MGFYDEEDSAQEQVTDLMPTESSNNSDPSGGYVHCVREQIATILEKNAESIEKDSIKDIHESDSVFFLNFYSKALNPPESYLEALEIAGLDSDHSWARVSGTYTKKCNESDTLVHLPEFDAGVWNPLNDYKNIRERASRAGGSFIDTLWSNKIAFVKPTFPKEISRAYRRSDDKKSFRDKCWNTFQSFFHMLQDEKCGTDEKLGAHVNMHLWKTEKPFKPHLHFHAAIPMLKAPYVTSDDRDKALNSGKVGRLKERFENMHADNAERVLVERDLNNELAQELGVSKLKMHDYQKGHVFDSDKLRKLWRRALDKHWSDFMDNLDIEEVNIHVSWASKQKNPEKIMHKFRYKSRTPVIDFFDYYSGNYPGVEEHQFSDFMEHLFYYENGARVYGFNKWASNLHEYEAGGLGRRCPICGGELCDSENEDYSDASGRFVIQEKKYGWVGMDPPDGSELETLFF